MIKKVLNNAITLLALLLGSAILHASHPPIPQKYIADPKPEECGAAINKNVKRYDNINQALACMQKGYKQVYFGSATDKDYVADELKDYYNTLQSLSLFHFEKPIQTMIWYTSYGQKDALLLQKYLIELELFDYSATIFRNMSAELSDEASKEKTKILSDLIQAISKENPCIIGYLLDYPDDDIIFFYQYDAYQKKYIPSPKQQVLQASFHDAWVKLNKKPFIEWQEEDQRAFNTFIRENREWEQNYHRDRIMAEAWLDANEDEPIEKLTLYTQSFAKAIENLKKPAFSLTTTSTLPSVQSATTQSWWQRWRNTIGITALGAALGAAWYKTSK